jgi:hypothetical protein
MGPSHLLTSDRRRNFRIPGPATTTETPAAPEPDTCGAVATVHTAPQLKPVVECPVDPYNAASREGRGGAGLTAAAVQAVPEGHPATLPGQWLRQADTDNLAIGRKPGYPGSAATLAR